MRLTNKLAIITGAGSGFGAGIARRFAEEGCRVVVNDIDAKSGERVAKEIHGSFIQADVTKGADWARLVRAAGPALDIVVNNAGWTHRNKPYLEVSEAEFDKVYAVNVKSVYLSALHAVPVSGPRWRLLRQHRLHCRHRPRPGLTVTTARRRR
jgi:3-oxoacyl-[acyl-carrier protein] reductase